VGLKDGSEAEPPFPCPLFFEGRHPLARKIVLIYAPILLLQCNLTWHSRVSIDGAQSQNPRHWDICRMEMSFEIGVYLVMQTESVP
jgi:hypothetical protein